MATNSPNTYCSLKDDKSGCEEVIKEPETPTQDSSGFFIKGIYLAMVLLCILI